MRLILYFWEVITKCVQCRTQALIKLAFTHNCAKRAPVIKLFKWRKYDVKCFI